MLRRKRVTAFFLACLMLFGTITPLDGTYAQDENESLEDNRLGIENDSFDVDLKNTMSSKSQTVLSDIRLKPLDQKSDYLTHEKVTFDVGFSTSNTSGKLDNTKLVITFPAEYIKLETPDNHTDDD